jgi:phage terminase large subunit-like protein
VPYTLWAKDEKNGLSLTPGNTCDYAFIRRDILQFCKERTVKLIAVDPHNSHYLVQQLQAEGLSVQGFSQSFASMNPGTKLLSTLIAQSRLRTSDNPILNWMAGNATTKENHEGYVKVTKPSAMSPLRVDGIVALIMAVSVASDAPAAAAPEPEILIL